MNAIDLSNFELEPLDAAEFALHLEEGFDNSEPDILYSDAELWDSTMGNGIIKMNDGRLFYWE